MISLNQFSHKKTIFFSNDELKKKFSRPKSHPNSIVIQINGVQALILKHQNFQKNGQHDRFPWQFDEYDFKGDKGISMDFMIVPVLNLSSTNWLQ